ncbi:MAG: hypothetical protein V4584_00260 [Verrucomicrobiota bacterium]
MNIPSVSYDVVDESGYFYVSAKVGCERVGELLVDKIAVERARLGSIEVKCDWSRRRSWRERLKKEPLQIFDTISFRNRGIATNLIERLAGWCSRNGVGEVFGSVVESDLKKTPRLLEWYERRGFRICEPTDECLPESVKMVVWKSNTGGCPNAVI